MAWVNYSFEDIEKMVNSQVIFNYTNRIRLAKLKHEHQRVSSNQPGFFVMKVKLIIITLSIRWRHGLMRQFMKVLSLPRIKSILVKKNGMNR